MRKYFIIMMIFSAFIGLCGFLTGNMRSLPSNVSFVNKNWQKIHLQVRKGFFVEVDKNELICDRILSKGQIFNLKAKETDILMYRRDINPDKSDGKNFTDWVYANCPDSNCVISNP